MQQAPFAMGLFALCLFFVMLFLYAALTGRHVGRYGTIDRTTTPTTYWLGQGIYAVLILASATFGFFTLP